MNNWGFKTKISIFILGLLVTLSVSVSANNQSWVLGFYNFHTEQFVFKEHNSFYRYADSPTPNAFDVSPFLPNRFYLEWYLWGKQGLGVMRIFTWGESYSMDSSADSPFHDSREYTLDAKFETDNYLVIFPRIWIGEDDYVRLGTIIGCGISKYSLLTSIEKERSLKSVNGPALMAGAFVDWGGASFGARLGIAAVSSWYPHMEYNGHKLNVNTTYISRSLDFRWAW